MAKMLFTGMWTFARPDAPGRQFGSASGIGPTAGPGSVLVTLDLRQILFHVDGTIASARIPEDWVTELARVLGDTVLRLRHLRELHKLRKLATSALYDDEGADSKPPGSRILGADHPRARAFDPYVAPRPASPPEITSKGIMAVLSFESIDRRHVRVTFEKLDSIRIARGGAPYEVPPELEDRPDELRVAIVEGSRWLEERRGYVAEGSSAQHYVFFFEGEIVEALAEGFWVEYPEEGATIESTGMASMPLGAISTFDVDGIMVEVFETSSPIKEVLSAARLGSQVLYQCAAHHGGESVMWRVTVRQHGDTARYTFWEGEQPIEIRASQMSLDEARALVEERVRIRFPQAILVTGSS
jgi:hypothetical protein